MVEAGAGLGTDGGLVLRHPAGENGRILVLSFGTPEGPVLTQALRAALSQALGQIEGAEAVVLLLRGGDISGPNFPNEGEESDLKPQLSTLCQEIEALSLPVIAAFEGGLQGDLAELALAAHYRLAARDARLHFNGVTFGLPPQAGATQILPRLVGTPESLRLLLKAQPLGAEEGVTLGVMDRLFEGDALAAALEFAAQPLPPRPNGQRRAGLSTAALHAAAIAGARASLGARPFDHGPSEVLSRVIDCIDAALYLPYENGRALEAVAWEDLKTSDTAQALIAAARAEHRATQLPARLAAARPHLPQHLGLMGSSPQIAALAYMALSRGFHVLWVDPDRARLTQALGWLSERQAGEIAAGRLSPAQREADLARLRSGGDLQALAGAGLIFHAGRGPNVATAMALFGARPQLVLGGGEGLLGLAIAPNARLAEVALPEKIAVDHMALALQVLRRLALMPLIEGKMPLVGRRMTSAGRMVLTRLMEMGVARQAISGALEDFGMPMPDLPEVTTSLAPRVMARPEILRRWLGALALEGFALLEARVAMRPSDIDLVLVQGYGFPRWRGGPMHQAGRIGLMVLRADLRKWMREDALWTPHPLLDRMIADGRRLESLDL